MTGIGQWAKGPESWVPIGTYLAKKSYFARGGGWYYMPLLAPPFIAHSCLKSCSQKVYNFISKMLKKKVQDAALICRDVRGRFRRGFVPFFFLSSPQPRPDFCPLAVTYEYIRKQKRSDYERSAPEFMVHNWFWRWRIFPAVFNLVFVDYVWQQS